MVLASRHNTKFMHSRQWKRTHKDCNNVNLLFADDPLSFWILINCAASITSGRDWISTKYRENPGFAKAAAFSGAEENSAFDTFGDVRNLLFPNTPHPPLESLPSSLHLEHPALQCCSISSMPILLLNSKYTFATNNDNTANFNANEADPWHRATSEGINRICKSHGK